MEAGKPWWKSENEKVDDFARGYSPALCLRAPQINLQGMGLSIELEEGVPGLGRKKQPLEVSPHEGIFVSLHYGDRSSSTRTHSA
ncbi:hypothetical protein FOZ63_024046 [Perkinsus olseni]|uniref:Uncharacterized protein n=1 Tax=Perkinsus olseni TaxID=32597 RepID=A0A7J6UJ08_PEROL|nr:hypothetical protein FOZ63_024046 [Perkinsus olseni]